MSFSSSTIRRSMIKLYRKHCINDFSVNETRITVMLIVSFYEKNKRKFIVGTTKVFFTEFKLFYNALKSCFIY